MVEPHAIISRTQPGISTNREATDARPQSFPLSNVRFDGTNLLILDALAHHGRSSIREIAGQAGLSETAVRERVSNLEAHGVVQGYGARIDWALAGLPIQVLFEAQCPPNKVLEVAQRLQGMPNVVQAIATTGSPNLLAVLRARDFYEVRKLLAQISVPPLHAVKSRIALQQLVAERPPRVRVAGLNPALAAQSEPSRATAPPAVASPAAPPWSPLATPGRPMEPYAQHGMHGRMEPVHAGL